LRLNPLHNIVLKAGAVALALLLWVHVATNKTYEYQLDLPLQVINVPQGLVLVSDLPAVASVKVRATGKQLLVLASTDPAIFINAGDGKPGTVERPISSAELSEALGRSFDYAEVTSPRALVLKFEREVGRRVMIRSAIRAEAGAGYALLSTPHVQPDTITVIGPASVIQQLKYVETVPKPFLGLTSALNQRVPLALPESLKLSVRDSMVTVQVEVEPAKQKTFSNLAIIPPAAFPSGRYDIVPSHLTLSVEIPQSKYNFVGSADVSVSFRRPLLAGDTIRTALEYILPPGVEIVGPRVDSVTLIKRP
jgi:YbbR domain-containing protein